MYCGLSVALMVCKFISGQPTFASVFSQTTVQRTCLRVSAFCSAAAVSALYRCFSTLPLLQHSTAASALYRCFSTLPLFQHSTAVSALCRCFQHSAAASVICRCFSTLPLFQHSAAASVICSLRDAKRLLHLTYVRPYSQSHTIASLSIKYFLCQRKIIEREREGGKGVGRCSGGQGR
jgi:hypothetical protein